MIHTPLLSWEKGQGDEVKNRETGDEVDWQAKGRDA